MKSYLNGIDAIADLHEKGFTNDFQLVGNDLLWVQEHIFLRVGEFFILEYHKITDPGDKMSELVVFGIIAPYHDIKGILLNHYKSYTSTTPPVLVKKLKELAIYAAHSNQSQLVDYRKWTQHKNQN
jgi:hypothetical protein